MGKRIRNNAKRDAKWQKATRAKVIGLSNSALLEATLEMARGDDYEGAFTDAGWFEFIVLKTELNGRLELWLKEAYSRAGVEVQATPLVSQSRRQFALHE